MNVVSQQMRPSGVWRVNLGLGIGVRALAVLSGLLVSGLAVTLLLCGVAPKDLCAAAKDTLGVLFIALAVGLVLTVMIAAAKICGAQLDRQ